MKVSQLLDVYRFRGPKHMSRHKTGVASFQIIKRKVLEDGTKIYAAQSPAIVLPGNEPEYSMYRQNKRPQ